MIVNTEKVRQLSGGRDEAPKNWVTRKFVGDLTALTHESSSSGAANETSGSLKGGPRANSSRDAPRAGSWPPTAALYNEPSHDSPAAAYNSSWGRNHALLWQLKGRASAELLGVHHGQHLDSRQLLGVVHHPYVATLPWLLTAAPADGSDLDEHPAD